MKRKNEKPEQTLASSTKKPINVAKILSGWLHKTKNVLSGVPSYGYIYVASLFTFPFWGKYPLASLIPVIIIAFWRGKRGWPIILSFLLFLLALYSYGEGIATLYTTNNLDKGLGYVIAGYFFLLVSVRMTSWYAISFKSRYYWFGEIATILSLFLPPIAMLYVVGAPFVGAEKTRFSPVKSENRKTDGDIDTSSTM